VGAKTWLVCLQRLCYGAGRPLQDSRRWIRRHVLLDIPRPSHHRDSRLKFIMPDFVLDFQGKFRKKLKVLSDCIEMAKVCWKSSSGHTCVILSNLGNWSLRRSSFFEYRKEWSIT
jgi:hypothetical protein